MRTLPLITALTLFSVLSASASDNNATGLSTLPAAAQAKISAALGRDSAEFYARSMSGGFQASGGGLATRFTSTGVEVRSGSARWQLALRGYGYEDVLHRVNPATLQVTKNRVEYRRGKVTEWYVNGPAGLEQGFTIHERPAKANGQPLTIVLETSGNLTAAPQNSGTSLNLAGRGGEEMLQYTGLTAYDSDSKELHASLRMRGQQLFLEVEDRGARYPVVVDPVVQLAKLTASDGGSLGQSVSISGNVVVAGTGTNAAYVFVKPPSGWHDLTQTAKLTPSDGTEQDLFGVRVAISGNAIVVGAPGDNQGQGSAYVFLKPPNGWKNMTETAKLVASDGAPGDSFGIVSISGGTVVVGALDATVNGNEFQGAAYVFVKPMLGWGGPNRVTLTESAKLTASDGQSGSFFGTSVSVSGDTIAVGAPFANQSGAGYVFVKPPLGWVSTTETAELAPSDAGGGVGTSIATNGNVVVAGALEAGAGGAAYVFVKPQSGWTNLIEVAQLLPTKVGWSFGISVAVDGTGHVIGVGAYQGNGQQGRAGAVFVYIEPPTGWQTTQRYNYRVFASDGKFGDGFGYSISVGQGTMAVVDAGGGAAYVFARQ